MFIGRFILLSKHALIAFPTTETVASASGVPSFESNTFPETVRVCAKSRVGATNTTRHSQSLKIRIASKLSLSFFDRNTTFN